MACGSTPQTKEPAPAGEPATVEPAAGSTVQLLTVASFPGIDLLESDNHAFHTHGGPPAQLFRVRLRFGVNDHRAHTVEARRVELVSRSCREETWSRRERLAITGHRARPRDAAAEPIRDERVPAGAASVTMPATGPRAYDVEVEFEPASAYQACDLFAYVIDLVVDRIPQRVEIPLHVEREEPDPR